MRRYNLLYVLCLFFAISCPNDYSQKHVAHADDLVETYDKQFRNLHQINDKSELEKLMHGLEDTLKTLKAKNSPYVLDFEDLITLFDGKIITRESTDPSKVFSYMNDYIRGLSIDSLVQKYQKVAPKCLAFDPVKDREQLDNAFNEVKNYTFVHNGKSYRFLDALQKWMALKGLTDEKMVKDKLSRQFEGGICKGLERFVNRAFCQNVNIDENSLALSAEKNFSSVLTGQIKEIILSALLKHGENRDFTSAHEAIEQKYYSFSRIFHGFLPRHTIKDFVRNHILKRLSGPSAIYMGFRSGVPHAVSLQVVGDKIRLIDNNFGILLFDDQEKFLDAFAGYLVRYYGDSAQPRTVFFIKTCL